MGTIIDCNIDCFTYKREPVQSLTSASTLREYKAESDVVLGNIERDYNLLSEMEISYFSRLLSNFNNTKKVSSNMEVNKNSSSSSTSNSFSNCNENVFAKDQVYEVLPPKLYLKFIDDIIINYYNRLHGMDKEEEKLDSKKRIFVDWLKTIFNQLSNIFKKYSTDKFCIFKKYHFLSIGLLYCSGEDDVKLNILYNVLCDEDGIIYRKEELKNMLISLILIPTKCLVDAKIKLGLSHFNLSSTSKKEIWSVIELFDLTKIEKLVDEYVCTLFIKDICLEKEEFMKRIRDGDLIWILYPNGIRQEFENKFKSDAVEMTRILTKNNMKSY